MDKDFIQNKKPLVSIFIPVWNGADLISRAIESCMHQTYDNIEIVVIDDASQDKTREIVEKYAAKDDRIKYSRNQKNLGFLENYLSAYQFLSGEYVQLLCHDDWLSKNYIEEGIKSLNSNPGAVGALGTIIGLRSEEGGELHFVSEFGFKAGSYSIGFVLKHFFWQGWGAAFFSLFKREYIDVSALKIFYSEISNDSLYGHLYSKGVGSDYFILLNILKKYESYHLVCNNKPSYFNLLRPMSTGFFINSENGKPLDELKLNRALLNGYLQIFVGEFEEYRFGVKMFIGANVINYIFNPIRNLLVSNKVPNVSMDNVKIFFNDYSFLEKLSVLFYALGLVSMRLWKFLNKKFRNPVTTISGKFN